VYNNTLRHAVSFLYAERNDSTTGNVRINVILRRVLTAIVAVEEQ